MRTGTIITTRRSAHAATIVLLSAGLLMPATLLAQQEGRNPSQPRRDQNPPQRDQNQPQRDQNQPQNQQPQDARQQRQGAQPQDPQQRWYDPFEWYGDQFEGFETGQRSVNQGVDQRTVPSGDPQRTTPEGDLNRNNPERDFNRSDPSQRGQVPLNQPESGYAMHGGQRYDRSWWNDADQTMRGDGYYDGYYDGYDDDEFGYDHFGNNPLESQRGENTTQQAQSRANPPRYDEGYQSGYYDGFYDRQRGYESDWTYYLSPEAQDAERAQAQERERIGDERRVRGDRARDFGTGLPANAQDMRRYRGTVSRVDPITATDLGPEMQGRGVVRITLDNGDTFLTDLGPGGDPNIISQGDRLSVLGSEMQQGQRTFINASRMRINDRMMWNTRDLNEPSPIADPALADEPARSDEGSRPRQR